MWKLTGLRVKLFAKKAILMLRNVGLSGVADRIKLALFSEREIGEDFSCDVLFKGSAIIRKHLKTDEDNFRFVDGPAHRDCRAYFFYGICDEIAKAGTAFLSWQEFMSGPELAPGKTQEERNITRVVVDRVLDEQNLWRRKLLEHLVNSILLSQDNHQHAYRAVLAAQSLVDHLGLAQDHEEFYSCKNLNNAESIRYYASIIEDSQNKSKVSRLPLLSKTISANNVPKVGSVFESMKTRFKKAIALATDDERLILRQSYGAGYSQISRPIHGEIIGLPRVWSAEDVSLGMSEIGLIASNLLLRIQAICKVPGEGILSQLERTYNQGTNASSLVALSTRRFSPGDLVMAQGVLSEILSCKKSPYGYSSCRFRYLGKPLIDRIPEDELPARYFQIILRKRDAREYFEKHFRMTELGQSVLAETRTLSDAQVYESIKKTLIEMEEKVGLQKLMTKSKPRASGA